MSALTTDHTVSTLPKDAACCQNSRLHFPLERRLCGYAQLASTSDSDNLQGLGQAQLWPRTLSSFQAISHGHLRKEQGPWNQRPVGAVLRHGDTDKGRGLS